VVDVDAFVHGHGAFGWYAVRHQHLTDGFGRPR
jgi:hypothetical protein